MVAQNNSRQLDVLRYIHEQVSARGYPPTVREIGVAVNLSSSSTVHGHLSRLEKKGYIHRDPTKPRAIELTAIGLEKIGIQPSGIPLLGTVAAGSSILAIEEASEFFPIPPDLNSQDSLFMLEIQGESMINVGILNGDYVIVRRQATANNGEIVIAMTLDNEATCKRFFKESNYIRLEAENDTMDAILLDDATILGKVVGLYRNQF